MADFVDRWSQIKDRNALRNRLIINPSILIVHREHRMSLIAWLIDFFRQELFS